MKTTKTFKRVMLEIFLGIYIMTNIIPLGFLAQTNANSNAPNISYPLKTVAKLRCRFTDFKELDSSCKQSLPILHTKDYEKYIKQNSGFNTYTRYYTTLWGASYKYGWDVGFGGHEGTDIVTSKGTPVYSIADGKVIVAKKALGWGNVVTVEHYIYGRKVFSNYAHLSKITVKKGQKVKSGTKIGEVGSTGNSTGNHLHLQIDLDTPFHPFYYNYKTCSYSYHDITEKGVCFDELAQNTIDPLLFLETKGTILKSLKTNVNKVKVPTKKTYSKVSTTKKRVYKTSGSIWNKTVYIGYPKGDVRQVQQILRDLKLYNGDLTGDYRDIENIIFKYQVKKGILSKRSDLGAGRFGPKTRFTLKKDYDKFLKNGGKHNYVVIGNKKTNNLNPYKIKKISRTHIKTRAEIEAEEYKDFMDRYNFNLNISGENIYVGNSSKIKFEITKKQRRKKIYFRGITPLDITIVTDEKKLKVFPKRFSYFKDGPRIVKLTGISPGITNVKIIFGNKVLKTYRIRIIGKNEKIYLKNGMIYGKNKLKSGQQAKAIALFSDKTGRRLVNIKYNGTYKIRGIGDTKICVKTGRIKAISKIFRRDCFESEFKKEVTFTYNDTIAGLLLFNYKSNSNKAQVEIINTYNNSTLAKKTSIYLANNSKNISYLK